MKILDDDDDNNNNNNNNNRKHVSFMFSSKFC